MTTDACSPHKGGGTDYGRAAHGDQASLEGYHDAQTGLLEFTEGDA